MDTGKLTVTIKTQTETEREADALRAALRIQEVIEENNPDDVIRPGTDRLCAIILGRPEPKS